MVPQLKLFMYFILDPIPNLETDHIMKEKKSAYVFGDGMAWEIIYKTIVQSCLIFLNKRWMWKKKT
jgi:hypothetical protein